MESIRFERFPKPNSGNFSSAVCRGNWKSCNSVNLSSAVYVQNAPVPIGLFICFWCFGKLLWKNINLFLQLHESTGAHAIVCPYPQLAYFFLGGIFELRLAAFLKHTFSNTSTNYNVVAVSLNNGTFHFFHQPVICSHLSIWIFKTMMTFGSQNFFMGTLPMAFGILED